MYYFFYFFIIISDIISIYNNNFIISDIISIWFRCGHSHCQRYFFTFPGRGLLALKGSIQAEAPKSHWRCGLELFSAWKDVEKETEEIILGLKKLKKNKTTPHNL